jgi:transcriptional regulator with XRE-family HTH domain
MGGTRGGRLRALRGELGLTLAEVAELSGLSLGTLLRIENHPEMYRVNYSTAEALADALYVEVSDIFDAEDLSNLGRPARTGRPLGSARRVTRLCEDCHLVAPSYAGACAQCGGALIQR